ncbi:lipocalin family protein [Chlorobaculum sp. 24CR]|jgi:apolipoprotein D and lipocalin family protein|uniref:lipocalin family protein n=1 Tax=Chlorobaculum sp. 24CR TaxID=2508878 RepID=UPI001431E5A4|nr:lipocalin family protein [Chlorobaculum sp. 24CR]
MFKNLLRKYFQTSGPGTVPEVDVLRYCGTWYEVAAIPGKQQRGCANTKAEYTFDAVKGQVMVRNSCKRKGRKASIRATAVPVAGSGNAKLIVTFFRWIKADYWVVGLAEDYSWALVSNPDGSRCWMLSRTPYMDETLYRELLDQLRLKGIDTSRLVKTSQG